MTDLGDRVRIENLGVKKATNLKVEKKKKNPKN